MAAVQQKNLKDTVTIRHLSPQSTPKRRGRSEKNSAGATGLILMDILLIPHVQDNIPILPVA
ncbi:MULTISPECIES: hypothetical protein [Rhizobium]|uniref:Uncharacterized protein n=1 Tax=Rhizobium paranaense TaxID=1650438 RepID=A0A7W8XV92_9HYPH|nr:MULTISPECIES: hypothetical protein [Rhizobium]MBB5576233.1 hypothetical protein [Rhizobium paranaense]MDK4741737.1 hypothetical protein [Rhizobium sp. CNPSo 3464]